MRHVDVVRNRWDTRVQELVARVTIEDAELQVTPLGGEQYVEIVRRPLLDVDGGVIHPDEDPKMFFEELHHGMQGSYLFATPPHDDHECDMADEHVGAAG